MMRLLHCSVGTLFAWLCLIGILVLGIPLFVRMPVWVDVTYHDLSAHNIMWGGVHYRDIFETNLPGMVWLHMLVRSLFGWSSEAIRLADLVIVGSAVTLLTLFLHKLLVQPVALVWFVFTAAFFYLFQTEFIHCQRDGWMLLPTVLALHLRSQQVQRSPEARRGLIFRWAILEGCCWACAVWIKPHALVPALFVWLASQRRVAAGIALGSGLVDFLGLLLGGFAVGLLGSCWLWQTGTWPHLWEVLLNWNHEYYKWTLREMNHRMTMLFCYFAPWSLAHGVAIPLALAALWRGHIWRKRSPTGSEWEAVHRSLLAALYLGWLVEATFLQKSFNYSHAPVILLALAFLASYRLPIGPIFLTWSLLAAALLTIAEPTPPVRGWVDHYDAWIPDAIRKGAGDFVEENLSALRKAKPVTFAQVLPRNHAFDITRLALWPRCLSEKSTPELKDALALEGQSHCVPRWTDLAHVADFLRRRGVKDRELICWHDTTHPLYLDLKVRPAIRFIHVNTTLDFKSKRALIQQEVAASGQRYVVSDLAYIQFFYYFDTASPPNQPYALPTDFPDEVRHVYPWNQPILYRSGRYFVHEVTNPLETIITPIPPSAQMPDE